MRGAGLPAAREARERVEVERSLEQLAYLMDGLLRMAANIAIDYLLGSVPVVGDIFDAAWKSNQMNVELLRRRAAVTPEEAARGRTSDWLFLAGIVLVLLIIFFGTLALSLWLLWLLASALR